MTKLTVETKLDEVYNVLGFLEVIMDEVQISRQQQIHINTAVEEIFVNIVNYAFPETAGAVTVCASVNPEKITIEFCDNGIAFDPVQKETPDISLPLKDRPIGGLGILMTKEFMDSVKYERIGDENVLTLEKIIKREALP